MSAWLRLVPSWAWWALALVLVAGAQQYRVMDARGELAGVRAEWSEAARQAEARARSEEQRRQREIEGVRDDARGEMERASADARSADERAGGLQREVDRLRASRGATCDTIAAQRGQAAGDAFSVLADVFVEVERAGRAMAAEADRRGIAGSACEAAYRSLSR